ncbi:MAG: GAF domain-containing SpoIIE family protein phosphatase, partial [Bacillota bacterium]
EVALINEVRGSELEILKAGGNYNTYLSENEKFNLYNVYCEKVVKNQKIVEIPNATKAKRWKGYPLLEKGLISYLGYPILSSEGKVLGTICVEDTKERYFDKTEKELLFEFKKIIENQINQSKLTQKLEDILDKGQKLHHQFLPSHLPEIDNLSFGTYYKEAGKLGGDFYDVIDYGDKLLFYVSDVSGHDLTGSMLNIFLKENLYNYLHSNLSSDYNKKNKLSTSNIMNYLSKRFKNQDFPVDYFISLVIGIIDKESFKITINNGGFQFLPFVTKENGDIFTLFCKGMPITGLKNNNIKYNEITYYLKPKETLHIHTDGVFEQKNTKGQFYKDTEVWKLFSNNSYLKPEKIVEKLYKDFFKFKKGIPQQDDVTSFLIQRDSDD